MSHHVRFKKNHAPDQKISIHAVIAFLLTFFLCLSLVCIMTMNRSSVERLTMEHLILEKSIKINDVLSKLLYKTQMLSSLVLQDDNHAENFEQIASTIIDDPAILNILIAPSGVVSNVYPLAGNESVRGLDFFSEGAGNKEAVMAKETGQLVLGGPFNAVQGGQILVGRLPIYIDRPDGTKRFWGLVSVTLKYPQALDGAGLNELGIQGFAYELWRINPDNHERQIIASSGHSYNPNTNYVEKTLSIANAEWYFRILPVRTWYEFPETWISIFISILISLLVSAVIMKNKELQLLNVKLEHLSNTDPLTGVYNRRFFMDHVFRQSEKMIRTNGESFIIIFDLDHFKNINDRYGHQAGDTALKETAMRAVNVLRPYDIVARYGGEEFILFIADIDKNTAIHLAERIRANISKTPVQIDDESLHITASFGIAQAAPKNAPQAAIALADEALYRAKEQGRDKVMFCESAEVIREL